MNDTLAFIIGVFLFVGGVGYLFWRAGRGQRALSEDTDKWGDDSVKDSHGYYGDRDIEPRKRDQ